MSTYVSKQNLLINKSYKIKFSMVIWLFFFSMKFIVWKKKIETSKRKITT